MAPIIWEPSPDDPWGEEYIKAWEKEAKGEPNENVEPIEVVTRQEWGAAPPLEGAKEMRFPIQIIFFTHTQAEECHTKEECMDYLRRHQKTDVQDNEFPDIQYNFYIGGDLNIYEGRGWKVQADKDDISLDTVDKSIDVAYIGNFNEKEMSKELIDVGVKLARYGRAMEYLHLHYNIHTFWEDHVEELRPKQGPKYVNPLDQPAPPDIPDDTPEDLTRDQELGLLPRTI